MAPAAEIWKAKVKGPEGFEKNIAIKRVLPALATDPEFVKMFIDEAKLAAELVHPNVVSVFDFGKGPMGEHFLAMEYVAGSNLSQIVKRLAEKGEKLPVECALYVILEATRGLAYAHEKTDAVGKPLDIVHRDVSPQNILVSFGGDVKVADFGIAKLANATQNTTTGQIRGKLGYLAPERAELKPIHWRSDFFSLGIVLYELVSGQRLFVGQESEVLLKLVAYQAPPADEIAKMPGEVGEIVRGMLQRDPAKRLCGRELEVALVKLLGPEGRSRRSRGSRRRSIRCSSRKRSSRRPSRSA